MILHSTHSLYCLQYPTYHYQLLHMTCTDYATVQNTTRTDHTARPAQRSMLSPFLLAHTSEGFPHMPHRTLVPVCYYYYYYSSNDQPQHATDRAAAGDRKPRGGR